MRLLITGAWRKAPDYIPILYQSGHEIAFLQNEQDGLESCVDIYRHKISLSAAWAEGVVCNTLFVTHPMSEFTHLRYIQLTSSGMDRIDINEVTARGIEIHSAKGVYSVPMAEFAINGVLRLYKENEFFAKNQRAHIWEKHRNLRELVGKTVVIVGCGSVGTECAERFRAFGCAIIGVNRTVRHDVHYDVIVGFDKLTSVLHTADIIVLAVGLGKETWHLINSEKLQQIKKGAVIVNISRGAVVDTAALIDALRGGKLSGAVLDVFEQEPIEENSPLWNMGNVLITPHNSFVGEGNGKRLANLVLGNIENFMKATRSKNCFEP